MKMSLAEGLSLFLSIEYDADSSQFSVSVSSAYGGRDSVTATCARGDVKSTVRQCVTTFIGAWLTDVATNRGL